MAAQGNQTVYQRAEGESTQWEDIQRRLGNLPKKEPVEKPKPFAPAAERDSIQNLIEATDEDTLEGLEDDFADDKFLEEYRELRLKQLKAEQAKLRFGSVIHITREEFVREVTQASRDVWVVVHLYKDKVPLSSLLAACLERIAAKYTLTKFLKIVSSDCIPGYPDRNLPTLLVYKDTECKHNLVGVLPYGGRLTPDAVADALNKLGPICQEDEQDA